MYTKYANHYYLVWIPVISKLQAKMYEKIKIFWIKFWKSEQFNRKKSLYLGFIIFGLTHF